MEWFCFILAVAGALTLLGAPMRHDRAWSLGLVIGVAVMCLTGAVALQWRRTHQTAASRKWSATLPREGRSDGYVSSDTCQACHPAQYASWHRTYHRTMTQFARPSTVLGLFGNVTLDTDNSTFNLERRADEFWVHITDSERTAEPAVASSPAPNRPAQPWRISKRISLLTGSHHMQALWVRSGQGNGQFILPFIYLIEASRWVPRDDVFLGLPLANAGHQEWNSVCINCHTTAGQPRLQGKSGTRDTRVAELGIACEACHGPAGEHVRQNQAPQRRYHMHTTRQADATIINPQRLSKERSSQVCGNCHSIKHIPDRPDWAENGFRYRPGDDLEHITPLIRPTQLDSQPQMKAFLQRFPDFIENRFWSDGMVRVSGREYNGLIETPCYQRGQLSCLSCHSMHQSDPDDQLGARMETNEACLQCHETYRHRLEAHTHHPPDSSGSECYNCHMSHTTYGLLKAIRSHQIDSPAVLSSLKTGRPNACNLCHLDQSLGWTAQHLSEWFGIAKVQLTGEEQATSAALLWLLRGDAGQRALIAWSMGWEPAKLASGQAWLPPFLAQLLDDPYSAVRYIAQRSLRRIAGYQDLAYDFVGPAAERLHARQWALEKWRLTQPKGLARAGSRLLIDSTGALQQDIVENLQRQRNNRSVNLDE